MKTPLLLVIICALQIWSLPYPPELQLVCPSTSRCRRSSAGKEVQGSRQRKYIFDKEDERTLKYPKFARELRYLSGFGFSKTGKRAATGYYEEEQEPKKRAEFGETGRKPQPSRFIGYIIW